MPAHRPRTDQAWFTPRFGTTHFDLFGVYCLSSARAMRYFDTRRAPFFGPSSRLSSAVRWIAPTSLNYARAARLDSLLHPHKSPSSQLQNGQASTTFSKHVSNTRKMWPARQQRYILSMISGMAESGIAKGLLNMGEFGAVLFPSMVQGTTVYTLIPTGIRLV